MSDELRPCPFCGGEAEVVVGEICFTEVFAVYCKECDAKLGVSGRLCEVYEWVPMFDTREAAIEAWNRRAERTCKIIHRNDFDNALGEHSIWYECGFGILVANGTPEPVYCPGCGAKVVE